MIGDSHVAGKVYPHTVDSILKCNRINFDFHYFGINGAAFPTFCKEENLDSIYSRSPDVLIVHLGTNDSYSRRFIQEQFRGNLTQFYDSVRNHLPKVKIVFVTPFVNKLKKYIRRRKYYAREVNTNTGLCANVIEQFCLEHANTWCVNNNALHGMDFINSNLMKKDFVHLSVEGYELLGGQVAEELMRIPGLFQKKMWWNIEMYKIDTVSTIFTHPIQIIGK